LLLSGVSWTVPAFPVPALPGFVLSNQDHAERWGFNAAPCSENPFAEPRESHYSLTSIYYGMPTKPLFKVPVPVHKSPDRHGPMLYLL
jgi:hypothetical protein